MPDEAVMDAPEIEVPEIATETPEVEAPVATDEQQTTEETGKTTEVDSKLPLWKQAQPSLDKLKAENPALAAKIKDALFRDQALAKDLPEGIKAAVALRGEVTSLANALGDTTYQGQDPVQILNDVKGQLGYFHELDHKFTSGDKSFAKTLRDASPEAFQAHAPEVFAQFAEVNPDGYASYVSQAVMSHMNTHEVPLAFKTLAFMLPRLADSPEKTAVIAEIEKIFGWTEELKGFAAKPITPTKKEASPQDIESERQQLQTEKLDVLRQNWNNSSTPFGMNLRDKEVSRLAGKTQISAEDKHKIDVQVAEEWDARSIANKSYGDAMRAFLANGDQEGYKRRMHSEYTKLIPSAVRRAYDDVIKDKPKAAPTVKPTPTPTNGAAPQSNAGYKPISKYPVGQVDMLKTSGKDHQAGRLILKDGSKVLYRRSNA